MVTYVRDLTGRFQQRPHYKPEELDRECESAITVFLKVFNGAAPSPVDTEDLKKLIERDAEDLDVYADLSIYGPDVEGVTEFKPGRKPAVKIASVLTEDGRRENRLRTTLTHEWGHVHFHAYLWEVEPPPPDLLRQQPNRDKVICKRDSMLDAAQTEMALRKLGVLGGVLYVAAHPDDENTAMLAWLARERKVRTAYLSITRGDGGQNLIGTEQGKLLGLIRTEELLAARRIDGAEQLFTRTIDFGYSKSSREAIAK